MSNVLFLSCIDHEVMIWNEYCENLNKLLLLGGPLLGYKFSEFSGALLRGLTRAHTGS